MALRGLKTPLENAPSPPAVAPSAGSPAAPRYYAQTLEPEDLAAIPSPWASWALRELVSFAAVVAAIVGFLSAVARFM